MKHRSSPEHWASDISVVLRNTLGADRFPINVEEVAAELSLHWFPGEPIAVIKGANLPGFEGALVPAPAGKSGWGIFYNNALDSEGRMRFTIAHEFGHYLIHRIDHPTGIQCSADEMRHWDSRYGLCEREANRFAASLLMPLDDFRRQVPARNKASISELSSCANRYGVSLLAALLRWIEFTERSAMLVLSRSGFALWARSSKKAFRNGLFIKTTARPPVPTPTSGQRNDNKIRIPSEHPIDTIWLGEPAQEFNASSDGYDFTISLIYFHDDRETARLT